MLYTTQPSCRQILPQAHSLCFSPTLPRKPKPRVAATNRCARMAKSTLLSRPRPVARTVSSQLMIRTGPFRHTSLSCGEKSTAPDVSIPSLSPTTPKSRSDLCIGIKKRQVLEPEGPFYSQHTSAEPGKNRKVVASMLTPQITP